MHTFAPTKDKRKKSDKSERERERERERKRERESETDRQRQRQRLSDVKSDDVIAKSHAICVLTAKSQIFARNILNTVNFTMDSTYFVDFNH